ncbi:g7097 [Coccomyxa viridis]|uniref:G7097 protein n=1 Tax=Coccomyxa viridis TaxID=1274662 RepID=A0ABP1G100_9CHLO
MIYVVTGTSRGIGLELVRQVVARGDHVVATARKPDESTELQELAKAHKDAIKIVQMDVQDADSIKAAAKAIEEYHPNGVDVLINDAGINSPFQRACEQSVQDVINVHRVNVLGPLMVTQAMLPLIRKGKRKLIVNTSSGDGSIKILSDMGLNDEKQRKEDPHGRSLLPYKMAKTSLNMMTMTFAIDLKDEGITVICYCPGWVRTDMGMHAASEESQPEQSPEESVKKQLKLFDGMTLEGSGWYYQHTGEKLPY